MKNDNMALFAFHNLHPKGPQSIGVLQERGVGGGGVGGGGGRG